MWLVTRNLTVSCLAFCCRLQVLCVSHPQTQQCCRDLWQSWSLWCSTVRTCTRRWCRRSLLASSCLIYKGTGGCCPTGTLFRTCWSCIRDYASSVTITKLTKTECSMLLWPWVLCFCLCSGRIRTFRLTLSQWLMLSSWKPPRRRDRYKQKQSTHILSWWPFLQVNCTKATWYDEQNLWGEMILQTAGYIGFFFFQTSDKILCFRNHYW